MNKVIINEGGQPLFLEDLKFLQDASAEAIKALCYCVSGGHDSAILYGCSITVTDATNPSTGSIGTKYSWTEGLVAINGEVYAVASGTLFPSGNNLYWKVLVATSTPRTFKNGAQHDVREIRTATLTDTVAAGDISAEYTNTQPAFEFSTEEVETSNNFNNMVVRLNLEKEKHNTRLKGSIAVVFTLGNVTLSNGVVCTYDTTKFPNNHVGAYPVSMVKFLDGNTFSDCKLYTLAFQNGNMILYNPDGTKVTTINEGSAITFNINM